MLKKCLFFGSVLTAFFEEDVLALAEPESRKSKNVVKLF
jgi:hypothetical protein